MFLLTATYGDGAAPANATSFLKRIDLMATAQPFPIAILGFGDRQFPRFCQFAHEVAKALDRKGWASLMPLATIDRQSTQEFSRWGYALSQAINQKVRLFHTPIRPKSHALTLISRRDYGLDVQAPTLVLQFAIPRNDLHAHLTGNAWPRFEAGDLLGILPRGSGVPRYYSLASSTGDGILEICARVHPGGLCSGYLYELEPGDNIDAFIKPNPQFRPVAGRTPVILVGAGTGIGPLAGFIRANTATRPMHLYFGGRDPRSDFMYRNEINRWLFDGRLTTLNTAFSRVAGRAYVQDRLREDAATLRSLIADGAQIIVCGGYDMAAGVMEVLRDLLTPLDMAPDTLKAQGRYAEEFY
jgi:sulfite reductase (NADPH) flavoprotein alpha-component